MWIDSLWIGTVYIQCDPRAAASVGGASISLRHLLFPGGGAVLRRCCRGFGCFFVRLFPQESCFMRRWQR